MPLESAFLCPDGVPSRVLAGFEINYGTAMHGLIDIAQLSSGETLLVLGASGGVGMAALDIGSSLGAKVVACCSMTAEKRALCMEGGADTVVDYASGAASFKEALKAAGIYGEVDVVFDAVGGTYSEPALRALRWGGRHVVVGFASGGIAAPAIPRVPLNLVLLNERMCKACTGALGRHETLKGIGRTSQRRVQKLSRGELRGPSVRFSCGIRDFRSAFATIAERRVLGKVVISVENSTHPSCRIKAKLLRKN